MVQRRKDINPVLKAGLAHLWFVTIHSSADGNGRIARAIADMLLARSGKQPQRFYSMSAQIRQERAAYYEMLEGTQKGTTNITPWMEWFLGCLGRAIEGAQVTLGVVLAKARFWESLEGVPLNQRQRLILNRLLDGFEGKLTTSKYAKLAKCSQDTAYETCCFWSSTIFYCEIRKAGAAQTMRFVKYLNLLSSYDNIAGLYDKFWADWYLPAALPALENLFFSKLSSNSRVLDLCCGSGHVTKELVARGYAVTGVDLSACLIEKVRRTLPQAEFLVQDVRELRLSSKYEAALSTFDSLNHILSIGDLRKAFTQVRRHLKTNGLFVFDMNEEQAYFIDLRQWTATVGENSVGLVRGTYDPATKTALTELIWFEREQEPATWTRRESVVEQRSYEQNEIVTALEESGFKNVEAIPATDAGVITDLGFGRTFYIAHN